MEAIEIQEVCSAGWHWDTSRDLTCLYWVRRDGKGLDKRRRDWKWKQFLTDTTERGDVWGTQRERGDNTKIDTEEKNTFSMSVVVDFLIRRSSQGNKSSYLELIWHVRESFFRDVCGDTAWTSTVSSLKFIPANGKSSAMINLVVSSHCLLTCWPAWSHCYLVLALFVFFLDLWALNFDDKVFNVTISITIKKMLTQWGLEVGSSDLKYCQSFPPLFVSLIVMYRPFPHSNTTLPQLCCELNREIDLAGNTGGRGNCWISFCWIRSLIWFVPAHGGKGAAQDWGRKGGHGPP